MKWHSGKEQPKKTGWYVRDYREHKTEEFPHEFCVDYFDSTFWYAFELNQRNGKIEMNDAYYTDLPWAKIKDYK